MINNRVYIIRTITLSLCFYALIILVLYKVETQFHLPAYNHVSLDAKLHFLKHRAELDTADTIIIGSSMGLNNLNGLLLENASSHVDTVVNISAWNMKCTDLEPLMTRIVRYGNVKRIIYIAQYIDFTGKLSIKGPSEDTVFGYLNDMPVNTFFYKLRASKNLFNMIDHYLRWKLFTNAKTYQYLVFDRTGGSLIDINEHNANSHRWGKIDTYTLAPFEEENLACLKNLASLSQTHSFDLFFNISPFRKKLIESSPELTKIMAAFDTQTKEILQHDNTYHINTHHLLNLDDSNFADKSHLNIQGANTKTKKLVEIIGQVSSIAIDSGDVKNVNTTEL